MSLKKPLIVVGGLLALVILVAAASFFLFLRVFNVPTGAMANTIIPGDRVLCVMRINQIQRGDIVVFKLPSDQKVSYIQRVIGLPGERIQLRGTKVYVNGQELLEARTFVEFADGQSSLREISSEGTGLYRVYYDNREKREAEVFAKYAVAEPFQILPGHYFVLGDSRDNSLDSRYWGTVPRALIVGQALMIVGSESRQGQKGAAESRSDRMFKRLE